MWLLNRNPALTYSQRPPSSIILPVIGLIPIFDPEANLQLEVVLGQAREITRNPLNCEPTRRSATPKVIVQGRPIRIYTRMDSYSSLMLLPEIVATFLCHIPMG